MMSIANKSAGQAIPARITEVLQQMQNLYGSNLVVTRLTPSEIDLSVRNMTSHVLIANMMTRTSAIFGATGPATGPNCILGPQDFQILAEQAPSPGSSGLFLRYLPNTPNRQDYLAGYWFS